MMRVRCRYPVRLAGLGVAVAIGTYLRFCSPRRRLRVAAAELRSGPFRWFPARMGEV